MFDFISSLIYLPAMARIARLVVPGYPHHITQRGVRSMAVFRSDDDWLSYLRYMAEETKRLGVEILSWCLMTNHIHLVAVPSDEKALARSIGEAHKRYTRMRNFAEGVRGYLFQGRFGSCVLDEGHLLAAVRYVEQNPVRAGMVKRPWDYQWSSAQFHVGLREVDELVTDCSLRQMVNDWYEFLEGGDNDIDKKLRTATRTGRPAGGERFLLKIENLTRRNLRRKKPGRAKKSDIIPNK